MIPSADVAADTAADEAVLTLQLGRNPRGPYRVAVHCADGMPAVIETEAVLADGTPFPTRFWLTCPSLVAACARVESEPGWSEGRDGPYRNCLHREVAAAMAGMARAAGGAPPSLACRSQDVGDASGRPVGSLQCRSRGTSPATPPAPASLQCRSADLPPPASAQASPAAREVVEGWICAHRQRCVAGRP